MPLVDCAAAFASYRAAVAARVVKEVNKHKRDGEVRQAQPFLKVGPTTPAWLRRRSARHPQETFMTAPTNHRISEKAIIRASC